MAIQKSHFCHQSQFTFPAAYHRFSVNDSQAHFGVLLLEAQVFATAEAAALPPAIPNISRDDNGDPVFLPDRTDYVWEPIPSDRRSVGEPVDFYQIQVWNRKPQGRKQEDGGPRYIVDPAAFNSLLNKSTPIAGGKSQVEQFAPRAQAYRLVSKLPEFVDAVAV